MKLYNAYIRKNSSGKIDDLVIAKDGFSLTAFIFGPLWFLYHKMWQETLFLFAFNIAISLASFFSEIDKAILQTVLSFMIAINATYWYGQYIEKKHYQFLNIAFANSKEEALLEIKNQYKDTYFKDVKEFDADFLDPKISDKIIPKFFKRQFAFKKLI